MFGRLFAAAALGVGIFILGDPGHSPALAQRVTPAPALTDANKADIARVEAYLNGLHTLKARFQQIGDRGQTAEGTFYLSRPGRLRLEYDPPVPLLLIVSNGLLLQYDKDLKTSAYLPLSTTPAAILVAERIRLAGDVTVTHIERGAAVLRITLAQTADPRAGRITLVFTERPFALVNWQVVDAQGAVTRVALQDAHTDVALDSSLFTLALPATPPETR